MALSAISMNSALADKQFVLSLHHKLHVSTCICTQTQSINYSLNQSIIFTQTTMKPPSVMKLSPGIYSKKSYKTESHKANLTV